MNSNSLVSIGIPVFNAESTIEACIKSALSQTYKNLEIIISDNFSSDSTPEICRKYALIDPRITLVIQTENIGPAANFKYVQSRSSGEYFMWLASDDYMSPDFVEWNWNFLEKNLEYVASTSPNRFTNRTDAPEIWELLELSQGQRERIVKFLGNAERSNGLFYSLFRADALGKYPWLGENFLAWDWLLIFYLALEWKFHRTCNGFLILGTDGQSSKSNALELSGVTGIKKLWPLHKFSFLALNSLFRKCPKFLLIAFLGVCRLNLIISRHQFYVLKHRLKNKFKQFSTKSS